jgi:hypothetical protein
MPAKTTATAEKPATTTRKRPTAAKPRAPRTRRRKPSHAEIAERAYFIALDEGGADEFGNWLRAERELVAA